MGRKVSGYDGDYELEIAQAVEDGVVFGSNPAANPSAYDLTQVGQLDFATGQPGFDLLILWRTSAGQFGWGRDFGPEGSAPFSDFTAADITYGTLTEFSDTARRIIEQTEQFEVAYEEATTGQSVSPYALGYDATGMVTAWESELTRLVSHARSLRIQAGRVAWSSNQPHV